MTKPSRSYNEFEGVSITAGGFNVHQVAFSFNKKNIPAAIWGTLVTKGFVPTNPFNIVISGQTLDKKSKYMAIRNCNINYTREDGNTHNFIAGTVVDWQII